MSPHARVAPGRVRYRPGADTQESMERWWAQVARALAGRETPVPSARAAVRRGRPGTATIHPPSN